MTRFEAIEEMRTKRMTRFEAVQGMRILVSELKWLDNCNRRITGIWDKNENKYIEVQKEEYKEYQGNCNMFLQQMSSLIKSLSTENLYPHNDKYNRFRICYILYDLKKKQKELSKIMKENKLIPKRLYQVAPEYLLKIIEVLEEIKKVILEDNRIALDFSDSKDVLHLEDTIEIWLDLVTESEKVLPAYMSNEVKELYNSLQRFQEYSRKEIKNYEYVKNNYQEVGNLLADIMVAVSKLNKEKESIRQRAIIPLRIVEEIYIVYADIDKTIRETNSNIKVDYSIANHIYELPEFDTEEKITEVTDEALDKGAKATKEQRALYYKELKKKLQLLEKEVNNSNVFSDTEKFLFNDHLKQVQKYCIKRSEYLEGKRKYPFTKSNLGGKNDDRK